MPLSLPIALPWHLIRVGTAWYYMIGWAALDVSHSGAGVRLPAILKGPSAAAILSSEQRSRGHQGGPRGETVFSFKYIF